jgi:Uncharacterised protein family (UPF0158)
MATKVSLKEVVDALEMASDETHSYVNRATGQVITVTQQELDLAEEDSDRELVDWEQEAAAQVKSILESDDWLELPGTFDIHEWQIMEDFGRSLSSPSQRAAVGDAIHGAGAFRTFKAAIRRLGIEETWFAFKERALETIARDWLTSHDLLPDQSAAAGVQQREKQP